MQFDLPSGNHSKSKSQNKFSQPELARYGGSIERIGMIGSAMDPMAIQSTMAGASNKEKRQNYALNP